MSKIQCFQCKEMGHFANTCKRGKVCNYCKIPGHLISECHKQPQNWSANAYHATTSSSAPNLAAPGLDEANKPLTTEMVQQIVQNSLASAFSAMGFSGNSKASSIWYMDSGATHHMNHSPSHLENLTTLSGKHHIKTADGGDLPIYGIVSMSSGPIPLQNVLFSPNLTANLISVSKLVDNNCNVSFFS